MGEVKDKPKAGKWNSMAESAGKATVNY
jgi:hypothetical protein